MNPAHKFSHELKSQTEIKPVAAGSHIPVFPELTQEALKFRQLKEVIENMIARLDEGSEMTLTKDSIIVLALKEAIK